MSREKGMTLVELLVSMTVILLVIGAATAAYLKLLRGYKSQGKMAQSYMANLCGVELLRYDVEMAGFGLPSGLTTGATYTEAASGGSPYNPAALNDPSNPPRAFYSLDNGGQGGSDVLAIRSSVADINAVSRKSSLVSIDPVSGNPRVKAWGDSALDFADGDRFVVLNSDGSLLPALAGTWTCRTFASSYYTDANAFAAGLTTQDIYLIYGLDDDAGTHRMPFNRVDYYLERVAGQIPSGCAQSSYTLYRATVRQDNGLLSAEPLVDCVRDFQVAFGLDTDADGTIDSWAGNVTGMNASDIRTQVREVRAFVLYHEGTGDIGRSPEFRFSGILNLGDQDIANSLDPTNYPTNTFQQWGVAALPGNPQLSSFTPAGADLQYRWKVAEIAVKPMNLTEVP